MKAGPEMKSVEAGIIFDEGFNCAQSVIAVFAKKHGLTEEVIYKIASVFGAGMGRMQETCGAVTGAFMALGLEYGFKEPKDQGARAKTLQIAREFVAEFKKRFGTISCRELLGCDLNTTEGQKKHEEKKQRVLICKKCVETAVAIAENLMAGAEREKSADNASAVR
jgi:C_GCAxxG_C_C family probable redox protein